MDASAISIFPESASTFSGEVDVLYFGLWILYFVILLGITIAIVVFSVKYRKGTRSNRDNIPHHNTALEVGWSLGPLVIFLGIFVWAGRIFYQIHTVPKNAIEIYSIPKQWMWKFQHTNGRREIEEVHVPVGVPVKITLISQDVIHSFFVPAFRVKQDAIPFRYTELWFQATKPGRFPILCAEYCGMGHAIMKGTVVALNQADYAAWLSSTGTYTKALLTQQQQEAQAAQPPPSGGGAAAGAGGNDLASVGASLFQKNACISCHAADNADRAPQLTGVFGSKVRLQNGQTVLADENYIRESILKPNAKIVKGYTPLMPTFQGQLSEEDVIALIAYIKSRTGSTTEVR